MSDVTVILNIFTSGKKIRAQKTMNMKDSDHLSNQNSISMRQSEDHTLIYMRCEKGPLRMEGGNLYQTIRCTTHCDPIDVRNTLPCSAYKWEIIQ